MLDPLSVQLLEDCFAHLLDERPCSRPDLRPKEYRQQAFLSQAREDSGLEQRRLTQTGLAEEYGDRFVDDAALQLIRLCCAAAEKFFGSFVVGIEAGPGILAIELGADGKTPFRLHRDSSRRIARISSIKVLRRSASGSPPGARPKCSS